MYLLIKRYFKNILNKRNNYIYTINKIINLFIHNFTIIINCYKLYIYKKMQNYLLKYILEQTILPTKYKLFALSKK